MTGQFKWDFLGCFFAGEGVGSKSQMLYLLTTTRDPHHIRFYLASREVTLGRSVPASAWTEIITVLETLPSACITIRHYTNKGTVSWRKPF